jgi:hypothetical protein
VATTRLEVIVSPPDATLTLDGQALGTNPYVGMQPRDTQVHELVVAAHGYSSLTRRFTLERDLMLQLHLDPVKPEPAKIEPAPPPVAPPPKIAAHPPAKVRTSTPHVAPKTVAAPPPPPPEPAPTPPAAVVTTPPPQPPADTKRAIDNDVFDKKPKRPLDSNVFDDGSKKATIDRDNPWKK